MKHSNIDICVTIHLEKFKFETIIEESYCKPYFDLLLLFPLKYKKLWKTFEENTFLLFFSFYCILFIWVRTEQNVQKCAYVRSLSLHQFTRSFWLRGPASLTVLNIWREEWGTQTRKMVWINLRSGGEFFFCMFSMNCTHPRLFGFFELEMILYVCVCVCIHFTRFQF